MTHSPLPWIAEQNMIRQPILSKRRRIVCPPDHDGIQDAAFIVRACNARDELVKALKDLYEHCAMTHKHWGEGSNQKQADAAIAAGLAAIAKAEGRA